MKVFEGKDFDEVFKKVAMKLKSSPTTSPRGQKTKEIINACLVIREPEFCVLMNPHRKLSYMYLLNEMDWYKSGDLSIDKIKQFSSMWEKIADEDGYINSNYGFFAYHVGLPSEKSVNQYEWCLNSLVSDNNTRQAIINYNGIQHKYDDNKDFVCAISQQFFIRNKKLVTIVNGRSNDVIYGAGYDIPWFFYLQQCLQKDLASKGIYVEIGNLEFNIASMHTYERHFEMIDKVAADSNVYESKKLEEILS